MKFVWSQGKLLHQSNRAFLKGECDHIAGEWERKFFSLLTPTLLAVAVYAALCDKTPVWFFIPCALLVWLFFFFGTTEDNRKLARLTSNATLLQGEVVGVKQVGADDYNENNFGLTIRFQSPEGQTLEHSSNVSGRTPASWQIGDQVVVLFADNDNFWVL